MYINKNSKKDKWALGFVISIIPLLTSCVPNAHKLLEKRRK